MSNEYLESLLNDSYFTKVQKANKDYEYVKDYFIGVVGEEKADDYLDTFIMQFLNSDGILTNKEVAFYCDVTFKSIKQADLADRYKALKSQGATKDIRPVVDASPQQIKEAVIELAALCLVCDNELTDREIEDFEAFIKIINQY